MALDPQLDILGRALGDHPTRLEAAIADADRRLRGTTARTIPSAWELLPLVNGWVSYATLYPSDWEYGEFRRQGDRVELRGLLTRSPAGSPWVVGQVLWTFPPACRPARRPMLTPGVAGGPGTIEQARLDVGPDGVVTMNVVASANPVYYMTLAGLSFAL